ncbi:MaoC family dehydratase [Curtobacterium sp. Leaf261]|uniref:MaoC family dehydratase n=1 Tax=Curtobacterium sp. Leaf261 TaxID=1736311 RepID=UPI0006FE8C34|nr:MaoC family dehydratase [Curtobacterium sp. Leaf261]KQO65118.1 dehydratase [Curtobacterium sp. Leaf261]
MRFNSPAALVDAGSLDLGESSWLEVTQDMVDGFADATGDHQWIHVDPVRAVDGPFGGTIAHGYLTLALVPRFVGEVLEVGHLALAINAGSDRVRFVQPVPVGVRVRAGVRLVAAEPSGPGIRATVRVTVEIEGESKPALVADTLTIYVSED